MEHADQNQNDARFRFRIEDFFAVSRNRNIAKFSHFLDEREAYLARQTAQRQGEAFLFWGGFPGAQRVMLGVFPDYMTPDEMEFPLVCFTARWKQDFALSHRDFLGALMNLKIKRELIGDILVEPGRAVFFAGQAAAPLIESELTTVGRVGIRLFQELSGTIPEGLPQSVRFARIEGTVASLRLDAVTSLATGLSREKALALIKTRAVSVNYLEQQGGSARLNPGDILRIRGYGKFVLTDEMRQTKKDRIYLVIQKYI